MKMFQTQHQYFMPTSKNTTRKKVSLTTNSLTQLRIMKNINESSKIENPLESPYSTFLTSNKRTINNQVQTPKQGSRNSCKISIQLPEQQISMDKETLYVELQQQKIQLNEQSEENKNLKTMNTYLKNQLERFRLLLNHYKIEDDQTSDPIFSITQPSQSMHSIGHQRLLYVSPNSKGMIQQQDQEMMKIRNSVCQIKLKELENENSQIKQQYEEMRSQYELLESKIIKPDSSNLNPVQLTTLINTLTKDNAEMIGMIKDLENQNNFFQIKLDSMNKKFNSLLSKYHALKKLQLTQQNELQILKDRDNLFEQNQAQKVNAEKQLKSQLEVLQMENMRLQAALHFSQQQLQNTEKHMKLIQSEIDDRLNERDQETLGWKKRYEVAIMQLDNEKNMNVQKLKSMAKNYRKSTQPAKDGDLSSAKIDTQEQQNPGVDVVRNHIQSGIPNIGDILKFRLLNQRIDLENLDDMLFSDEMFQTDQVTYADMVETLQNPIFGLDVDQIDELSRYLTDQDDNSLFVSVARVKSIFKTLLGNYQLPTPQEQFAIENEVTLILQSKKQDILDVIQRKTHKMSSTISINDLIEAIKTLELPFGKQHYNAMMAFFFARYNMVPVEIQIEDLNNIFRNRSPQRRQSTSYNLFFQKNIEIPSDYIIPFDLTKSTHQNAILNGEK